jgi:triosephosphate isomerase
MLKSKKLIAGNWKMNGSLAANASLVQALLAGSWHSNDCEVALCVPTPYLAQVHGLINQAPRRICLGAQDLSVHECGAYTGEVSAAMLKDFEVSYAIVGHSERRLYHGETDELVAQKAQRALSSAITPIVCVGETLKEREAGQTELVVERQLASVIHMIGDRVGEMVVAYEPVWAIGTGMTATPDQAQAVHSYLRAQLNASVASSASALKKNKILYGGSMNAGNAKSLLRCEDVDGGLIGGASLKSDDFLAIISSV